MIFGVTGANQNARKLLFTKLVRTCTNANPSVLIGYAITEGKNSNSHRAAKFAGFSFVFFSRKIFLQHAFANIIVAFSVRLVR